MHSQIRPCSLSSKVLITLLSLTALNPKVMAAPLYWGQTTYSSGSTYSGTAATASNWYTDAAGTTVSSVAPNSLDDDIFFNTNPANTVGGTVTVGANLSAKSFTFNTSGATILAQDANRNLILGGGGITLNANSGNVNFGINTNSLSVRLAASQTWTNNSASVLNVRNIVTNSGAGPVALTLNAAGSGNIVLPLSVNDSVDNPLSIVVNSSGSGTITMASSTYRGGTTINSGKLSATGSLGSGGILLGNTTGSSEATLTVNSTAFANAITVREGSEGAKTLVTSNAAGVLNGGIVLEDSLSLLGTGAVTTLNGDISGTGSLIKSGAGSLVLAGDNTFSGNLTIDAGSLTLTDTGSLTFSIGANGVNNQINGSSASIVMLNGTFTFNLAGDSLIDGNSWSIVTVSNETYGSTFSIAGFTQVDNIWTNGSGLSFSEATGVLSYAVPEPSTCGFLMGGFFCLFAFGNRYRSRSPARR